VPINAIKYNKISISTSQGKKWKGAKGLKINNHSSGTKMDKITFYGVVDQWPGGELGLYKLPENVPPGSGSLIPKYNKLDPTNLAQYIEQTQYSIDDFRRDLAGIVEEAHKQAQGLFPGISATILSTSATAERQIVWDESLPMEALPDFLIPNFAEKKQYVKNSERWARQLLAALEGKTYEFEERNETVNQLTFYGVMVPYDGRELGLFQVTNPGSAASHFNPQYGAHDPRGWERHALTIPRDGFIDFLKDIASEATQQTIGEGDVTPLMRNPDTRDQVIEKRTALQNTIDFCNEVLVAFGER